VRSVRRFGQSVNARAKREQAAGQRLVASRGDGGRIDVTNSHSRSVPPNDAIDGFDTGSL
jgi:hypothetical protein